jgi:hypothetical protein
LTVSQVGNKGDGRHVLYGEENNRVEFQGVPFGHWPRAATLEKLFVIS